MARSDDIRLPFSITVTLPPRPGGILDPREFASPPNPVPGLRRQDVGGFALPNREEQDRPKRRAAPTDVPSSAVAFVVTATTAGFVPLAALEMFLAALIGVTYIAITLMDKRYRFDNGQEAADWASRIQPLPEPDTTPHQGLSPPEPLPPLPPLQAGPELPSHTGHDQPTVRLPALPQPGPPFTMPTTLPGRPTDEAAPTVFAAHTPGSTSRHARAAARRSDPEVVRHLDEADWWAHHLINLAAVRNQHEVIEAAKRAGWRVDDPANVAALPNSEAARKMLERAGILKPTHNSGHRGWNEQIQQRLNEIKLKLDADFGNASSPEKNKATLERVNNLQQELRHELANWRRITSIKGPPSDAG